MRIGLITGEYPPMQGGVGDFTHKLERTLTEIGHQVHVITGKPQVPGLGVSDSNVHRVVDGWRWGCWRQVLALAQELELETLNVQYQAAAYDMHPAINLVGRSRPQTVGAGRTINVRGRTLNVRNVRPRRRERPPVVVTFHDLKVPYLFPKAGPLRWQAVCTLARRADGVIVTNHEDYLRMERKVSLERLSLIPIGSNIPPAPPSDYDRGAERARWGVGPDDVLLGYFGFLNESKGGEELMRALAILVGRGVPAHLLMIGGRVGSSDATNRAYAEKVEGLIAELGMVDRVHWTGYTHPESVSAGLFATDACVLPYRDGVSFRRGTLHACLAHGRAVVTTRPAVPLPDVREGENMLLVKARDPAGVAEAVMRLVEDPALRTRLEGGATELSSQFAWERIARHTAAFFGRL